MHFLHAIGHTLRNCWQSKLHLLNKLNLSIPSVLILELINYATHEWLLNAVVMCGTQVLISVYCLPLLAQTIIHERIKFVKCTKPNNHQDVTIKVFSKRCHGLTRCNTTSNEYGSICWNQKNSNYTSNYRSRTKLVASAFQGVYYGINLYHKSIVATCVVQWFLVITTKHFIYERILNV